MNEFELWNDAVAFRNWWSTHPHGKKFPRKMTMWIFYYFDGYSIAEISTLYGLSET